MDNRLDLIYTILGIGLFLLGYGVLAVVCDYLEKRDARERQNG